MDGLGSHGIKINPSEQGSPLEQKQPLLQLPSSWRDSQSQVQLRDVPYLAISVWGIRHCVSSSELKQLNSRVEWTSCLTFCDMTCSLHIQLCISNHAIQTYALNY